MSNTVKVGKELLEDVAEFLDSCKEIHNSRDYYQIFDEQHHYDLTKKINKVLEDVNTGTMEEAVTGN
jgi:hypothetical protein